MGWQRGRLDGQNAGNISGCLALGPDQECNHFRFGPVASGSIRRRDRGNRALGMESSERPMDNFGGNSLLYDHDRKALFLFAPGGTSPIQTWEWNYSTSTFTNRTSPDTPTYAGDFAYDSVRRRALVYDRTVTAEWDGIAN